MITEFDEFDNVDDFLSSKPKRVNEKLTNDQLLKDLQDGATYISIDYNSKDKGWGVTYYDKNGVKKTEGCFETNQQVHEFLNANDIDYKEKSGYDYMKKFRGKDSKLYYRNFIY